MFESVLALLSIFLGSPTQRMVLQSVGGASH